MNRGDLPKDRFQDFRRDLTSEGHAAADQLGDRIVARDDNQRTAAGGGERKGRRADRLKRRRENLTLSDTSQRHVQLTEGMPEFRLKDDEQNHDTDDRGGVEDPGRNNQIELASQQHAGTQSQEDQRQPQRPRFATPPEQHVDRRCQYQKIYEILPADEQHVSLRRAFSRARRQTRGSGAVWVPHDMVARRARLGQPPTWRLFVSDSTFNM